MDYRMDYFYDGWIHLVYEPQFSHYKAWKSQHIFLI